GDHRHALAQEVGVLLDQGLGYDPGARHALALGHRGASFRQSTCWSTDESGARGGRNFVPALRGGYTTFNDVTHSQARLRPYAPKSLSSRLRSSEEES